MKVFLLFLWLPLFAFADGPMDRKKGFTIGTGLNTSVYSFPLTFEGETKKKISETALAVGPNLQLGYDIVMWNTLLLGLRAEGMLADTSGMNKDKSRKTYDHTKGKTRGAFGGVRLGYVFTFKGVNPVDDRFDMIGELFVEGGTGIGKNNFRKNYSYDDAGVSEDYDETIEETFNSQVISIGFNVTSKAGAFFEIKGMQTTLVSNEVARSGAFLVNGGSVQRFEEKLKDTKPDPIRSIVLLIGHHY